MCDVPSHLGPDDSGYYRSGSFALGFPLTGIIDVSSGHQPMANEDGSLRLFCDCEVYNQVDLRRESENRDHEFGS